MPSARRVRLLFFGVLALVVMTLMYTSRLRQSQERDTRTLGDFYYKTVNGLNKAHGDQAVMGTKAGQTTQDKDRDGDVDEDDEQLAREMAQRLKDAEQKAKDLANAKSPNRPDAPEKIVGIGSSADGQGKKDEGGNSVEAQETDEEHAVEVTLNDILKKSPVIIFSKSYCPYSKRAKGLLLEKYNIDPAPYVVELDEHPLGPQIQTRLGEMTGRRTVPNIMVNGKSIGGSDDIAELDRNHDLVEKIKTLGGKRVEMKERFIESGSNL
ncbi:putative glutaredoxin-c4 precursor protein [Phaeoacremonium minimum UCRPA7]|uniref:Putative glutaredoxin-c4 protein n=1 Tax=Phaeoacremonium minimum (strain UCR-PA7) TaxID=1286976 RepID=R8BVK6_PHAM7|nr:putative glutaredoxin-c4 precursor protein [Phaeoacremonium minimum UCRPA7]EOO03382.1 putative glutaredoxin-c4 precursor protein [Phaeoacremonium minimum UCRPA7]